MARQHITPDSPSHTPGVHKAEFSARLTRTFERENDERRLGA
jgi:hypothetical protein